MNRLAMVVLVALWTSLESVGPRFAMADETGRFVQDRFAIGFWVDPPADEQMDRHYADIAAANFTLAVGRFGATTPEQIRRQIELCEKYDLKVLVEPREPSLDKYPEGPSVWGYLLRDEPSAKDAPALRTQVAELRKVRPGRLGFINLFPNYASEAQLGTKTYDDYVSRFSRMDGVDVLCMDHYPTMKVETDTRNKYCTNLAVLRTNALKEGIPFWNFFNIMPFGKHDDPTEAQVRWQVYTSLAYGAKGVLYFCYWTPAGEEFPKGGAIITREGRKTRHYGEATRINRAVKNLGPTLMKLKSTGIQRIAPGEDPKKRLQKSPITSLTKGDFLVGQFEHADGRQAVLINNYNFAYTALPTVAFQKPIDQVREVSQETGEEIPATDDSPGLEGFQVSLDAGEGRLFLISR